MPSEVDKILQRLSSANALWLLLDYDGTLDQFAPTPEHILPNQQVIGLLRSLAANPRIRVGILSGRRLPDIEALVPVPAVVLAGTYGVEIRSPDGRRLNRLPPGEVRGALEGILQAWRTLTAGRPELFIEDKGYAVALHASRVPEPIATAIIEQARNLAFALMAGTDLVFLGGHRFLEAAPRIANKGAGVRFLVERFPLPGAMPVYIGDDDKDESAFEAVRDLGGVPVLVASKPRPTAAEFRLESPTTVQTLLRRIPNILARAASDAPPENLE